MKRLSIGIEMLREALKRWPEMFEDASTTQENVKKLIKGRVDLIAESKYKHKPFLTPILSSRKMTDTSI